jgi:hypothetical protein
MQLWHFTRWSKFLVLFVSAVLLVACGGGSAKPAVPATAPTQAPVQLAQPTAAPAQVSPTEAPKPTDVPKPTSTPAPTVAPAEPAPAGGDALNLLMSAMQAQLAAKSWRAVTTSEDGGTVTTSTVEFVAPSSMHMIMGAGQETIILKEGSYQKDKTGTWQKSPVDMSSILTTILDPKNVQNLLKDVTIDKLKFVGPDLIGGKPAWVYQYATQIKVGDQTINSTAKVWIGVLDKLPYRSESESDSIVNKGGKSKTTIIYEYDPNIKIEAPIK